jgi:hypothetical protein
MKKSIKGSILVQEFNTALQYFSFRPATEMDLSSFLKARIQKAHAGESDDSDSSDEDEGQNHMVKWWRRENKVLSKDWMDKRQLEHQMVQDPDKIRSMLLEKFGSIAEETSQQIAIKDVIDELNMIREVLEEQMAVVEDFGRIVYGFRDEKGPNGELVSKNPDIREVMEWGARQHSEIDDLSKRAEGPLREVRNVFVYSLKITNSFFWKINALLEIKLKQANASEARTTRVQAVQGAAQGKVCPDNVIVYSS